MEQARTVGRASRPLEFEIIGDLTEVDLTLLNEEKGSKSPAIKRLSERHHALARLIADGMKMGEAGLVVGYDPSRVSILKDDPAFKELVKFYQGEKDKVYFGMHEALAAASKTAVGIIQERLEETPDKVRMAELLEVAKMGADRTGHGPSSTQQVNVNVGIGDRLEAARKRIAERNKMIDITPEEGDQVRNSS